MATDFPHKDGGARVRWGWAVAVFVGLEIVMIAAAFAWVAIYSYVLQPGQSLATYQAYARQASPIVALVVGIPAFFAAGIWLRKRLGAAGFATAVAAGTLYLILEAAVMVSAAREPRVLGMFFANVPAKIGVLLLGARAGRGFRRAGSTGVAA